MFDVSIISISKAV